MGEKAVCSRYLGEKEFQGGRSGENNVEDYRKIK